MPQTARGEPLPRGSPKGISQNHALMYVSNGNGEVNVYGFSRGNLIGVLVNFAMPLGQCVDAKG
ncbi:MAG: hypothetical protein JO263_05765, partial [Candidatus Eremiobacteraeota bacterium]|nr:hypothetical protein [Candidatus Eremiobacteraeota bacterium]